MIIEGINSGGFTSEEYNRQDVFALTEAPVAGFGESFSIEHPSPWKDREPQREEGLRLTQGSSHGRSSAEIRSGPLFCFDLRNVLDLLCERSRLPILGRYARQDGKHFEVYTPL